jgi:hypothetical protein
LFPEERQPGPKPETLDAKLDAISHVDPQTGEITEAMRDHEERIALHNRILDEEKAKAEAAPAEPAKAGQRGPKAARKASPTERLQVEGAAAAAKGPRALTEWKETLNEEDVAHISVAMERGWKEIAAKAAA